jgi:hypothetical protein
MHPLDVSIMEIRNSDERKRSISTVCSKLTALDGGYEGRIKNRGLSTKLAAQFLHSISSTDFIEIFRLLLANKFSKDIRVLGDVVLSSFVCIFRLVGEYMLSEALVSTLGNCYDALHLQSVTNIFERVFEYLQRVTVEMVVEASEKNDSFCTSAIQQLQENKINLLEWSTLGKFSFTSKQQPVGRAEEESTGVHVRFLKVLQSIGSIVIHAVGVIQLKSVYTTTDVQVYIFSIYAACPFHCISLLYTSPRFRCVEIFRIHFAFFLLPN